MTRCEAFLRSLAGDPASALVMWRSKEWTDDERAKAQRLLKAAVTVAIGVIRSICKMVVIRTDEYVCAQNECGVIVNPRGIRIAHDTDADWYAWQDGSPELARRSARTTRTPPSMYRVSSVRSGNGPAPTPPRGNNTAATYFR